MATFPDHPMTHFSKMHDNSELAVRWIYDVARPYIKGRILEVASQSGNFSNFLIHEGIELKLSDADVQNCRKLQTKFEGNPLVKGIHQINILDKQFERLYARLFNKANTVIILNTMLSAHECQVAINNVKKFIKQNGYLIMKLPVRLALYDNTDEEGFQYWHHRNRQLVKKTIGKDFAMIETTFFKLSGDSENSALSQIPSFPVPPDINENDGSGLCVILVAKKITN